MMLANYRIEKMKKIANEVGVESKIRYIGGKYYAHVNGITFISTDYEQFRNKCEELKHYKSPEPMNLTERLLRIEERSLRKLGAIR